MLDLNYLPVHFSLFLIVGIVFGHFFDIPLTLIFLATILSFLFLIYFNFKANNSFNSPIFFVIFTGILFLNIGIFSIRIQKPPYQDNHYSNHLTKVNQTIFRISKILKPNKFYLRFEAEIIQINDVNTQGRILVNINNNSLKKTIKIDDILFSTNEFKEIRKALNPYEFDYKNYLKNQQIHHQLILKKDDFLFLISNKKSLKGFAQDLRERINNDFKQINFSQDELSIVNAILLGQRQDISKEKFEQYKNAGAIHILAVSGLHIGIILLFLNFLFKPIEYIKNGHIIKLILVILCLWMYAFLAGLSASVIRAVTMFTAIAIGLASNRQFGIQHSLIISLFIILLIHPFFLFDVGFQLSYTAVFSIAWLQPLLNNIWKPKFFVLKYLQTLLTVSFAAQIGILPLSLYYFHQFPGLFFVSSLVIIPFLGSILGIGFLIIILSFLKILPQFIANFYELMIKMMNDFVAFISHQESFIFYNISFSILLMIAFYLLLISSISWFKMKSIKNLYFVFITVLFFQLSLIYEKVYLQKTNEFIIFHQSKHSIFGSRQGEKMIIFQKTDRLNNRIYSPINSYKINFNNLNFHEKTGSKHLWEIDSKNIFAIDSLGIYNLQNFKPEIVVLSHSPKINLNRMLQKLRPKIIIADGSNYTSFINLWEKSCENAAIRFYDTSKNGAFVYKY